MLIMLRGHLNPNDSHNAEDEGINALKAGIRHSWESQDLKP
jgi:hypothetical protein